MNISRLEALEAHLDADKEYMVLAKRKEVVNLNNYFQQNSIKAKALTFNELEVQENIKHLLKNNLINFGYLEKNFFATPPWKVTITFLRKILPVKVPRIIG